MITSISVSPTIIALAEAEAMSMGGVHNSILAGAGNHAGFIGEHIVAQLIGATRKNTKNYDLVTSDGITVDVKSKQTRFKPEDGYEASIARTSTHQTCDVYCFVRVLYNLSWAYVCGFYPKALYMEHATFLKKGDYDSDNDFYVKADCYNLPHHRLMSWEDSRDYALRAKAELNPLKDVA
jgi:hypothetical protein